MILMNQNYDTTYHTKYLPGLTKGAARLNPHLVKLKLRPGYMSVRGVCREARYTVGAGTTIQLRFDIILSIRVSAE